MVFYIPIFFQVTYIKWRDLKGTLISFDKCLDPSNPHHYEAEDIPITLVPKTSSHWIPLNWHKKTTHLISITKNSYGIYIVVSGLFTQLCFWKLFILRHVSVVCSFLLVSNLILLEYTTVCLFILLWMNI